MPLLINGHSSSTQVEDAQGLLRQARQGCRHREGERLFKDEKAKKTQTARRAVAAEAVNANLLMQIDELRLTRQELTTPLLTTRYSPLTTHYSLLTTHHSHFARPQGGGRLIHMQSQRKYSGWESCRKVDRVIPYGRNRVGGLPRPGVIR